MKSGETKKGVHKHRVLVTLTPSTYELLQQLSDEAGVAIAPLCGELIEEARPAFVAMLTAVRQAKSGAADAFDTLAALFADATVKSGEAQLELIEQKQLLSRKRQPKGGNDNAQ